MSDFLVDLSSKPQARRLLKSIGVPLPVELRRREGPWEARPLEGRVAVVGGAPCGLMHRAIATTLARGGARTTLLGLDEAAPAFSEAAEAWGRPFHHAAELPEDATPDLLVFDATGMAEVADLAHLHGFFHPLVRRIARCGRVVVLGMKPDDQPTPEAAAAQAALDGFVRSLGKELGRRGATANRVVVETEAEDRVEPVLRWLLSDRATFVDLQSLHVTGLAPGALEELPWRRPLDGKDALVTGAARGIGAATARRLAEEGARVLLLDRPGDLEGAATLARRIGGVAIGLDITDDDASEQLSAALAEHSDGGLDVIVHNAGVTRDKTLGRMDRERWDMAVDVNLGAVLRLTAHLRDEGELREGGRVVLLSSVAGLAGNAGQTNYAASKAGLVGALRKLAPDLAERGVTINAIAPGFIETRLTARIPTAIREVGRRLSALSQGGQPVDVAEAITFLASPGAQGLSGQVLRVCGGSFLGA